MSDKDKRLEQQYATLGISKEDTEVAVPTKYGAFVLKVLLPYEKANVLKQVSTQVGDGNSLYVHEAAYVRKIATLNVCVKTSPEWWSSAAECVDDGIIETLFKAYTDLEKLLDEKLKKITQAVNDGEYDTLLDIWVCKTFSCLPTEERFLFLPQELKQALFDGSAKIADQKSIQYAKSALARLLEMIERPAISFMAPIMRQMLERQLQMDGIEDDAIVQSEIIKKCEGLKKIEIASLKKDLGFDEIENPNLKHEQTIEGLIERAKKLREEENQRLAEAKKTE